MKRIAVALLVSSMLAGCADTLASLDNPELQTVAGKLAKCRAEGLAYLQTSSDPKSKAAAEAAYAVYESCKIREGVSGATSTSTDGGV